MKPFSLLLIALLCSVASSQLSVAQSGPGKNSPAHNGESNKESKSVAPDPKESRTAAQLFEEADNYARKKFEDFEKRKMPFDKQLQEKIKQEQQDLAARHAATVAARKVAGNDAYYLGMLYNLAHNFDSAFEVMRRFLNENPDANGEPAQNARAIVIIQAAKKGLLTEAEARLKDYASNQPQVLDDRMSLENWVAVGYFNLKDYEHALPHAQQVWLSAQQAAKQKKSFARDATLSEAAVALSEIDLKLKKDDDAIAVMHELRQIAMNIPSGSLYKQALKRLLQIAPERDPFKDVNKDGASNISPPEITVNEWIDQQPTKLADLRGKVVLLDFWATWCGPCVGELPNVIKTYEKHHDGGFEIIGVSLDQDEQKLKNFTKEKNMTWQQYFDGKGWQNKLAQKYGVQSIPATYLLDAEGKIIGRNLRGEALEEAVTKAMAKK